MLIQPHDGKRNCVLYPNVKTINPTLSPFHPYVFKKFGLQKKSLLKSKIQVISSKRQAGFFFFRE